MKIGVMYRFGAMGNMENGARLMLHLATGTSSHQTEWCCCIDGRTFNVFLKQYMRILVQQRFDHEKRCLAIDLLYDTVTCSLVIKGDPRL